MKLTARGYSERGATSRFLSTWRKLETLSTPFSPCYSVTNLVLMWKLPGWRPLTVCCFCEVTSQYCAVPVLAVKVLVKSLVTWRWQHSPMIMDMKIPCGLGYTIMKLTFFFFNHEGGCHLIAPHVIVATGRPSRGFIRPRWALLDALAAR